MNHRLSRILLFLVGKVIGDDVGWEREGQSCRTISGSGRGTKFGCGSMQTLKNWQPPSVYTCDFAS